MNFSHFIKTCGATHNDLAQQLGVSRSYITMLANGQKRPSWQVARRILVIAQGQVTADDLVAEYAGEDGRTG
jgi:DNA-binding XRE family transcriptional regulator